MGNTKIVQLHEIIKNSLATYLSYKWSDNRLYLKKRGKKGKENDDRKKKKAGGTVERNRSVINLENDVFIYDASNKTFTQLDLCDCFKNGVKYRKTDPFASKSMKKDFELYDAQHQISPAELRQYQSYQLVNVKDSVDRIFSNHMIKRENWTKTINDLCPSQFDLFIQKELNKCAGKNFDLKSFEINTKQEMSSTSNNDKVCSSATIAGYYTITTYDDGLRCENDMNKGRKLSTKQCNFIGIREETVCPKKFYSKGLQCKLSSELHRKEKGSKDLGIQCFYAPDHQKYKLRKNQMENRTGALYRHGKCIPLQKQKIAPSKRMRKRHGSFSDIFATFWSRNGGNEDNMMHFDSSAEIRKILNAQSDSSLSLSNTREFFRNHIGPKPLLTYYQSSSTSKDRGGDTNDDQYAKNEPIVGMLEAANNKISKVDTMTVWNKSGSNRMLNPSHNKNVSSIHKVSVSNRSGYIKRSEIENNDQYGIITEPVSASNKCSVHCRKYQPGKRLLCTCPYGNTRPKSMPEPLYKEPLGFPTVFTRSKIGTATVSNRSGSIRKSQAEHNDKWSKIDTATVSNRSGSIRRSQAEHNDKFSKINSATISNRSGSIKRSEIENNDQYGIITEPVSASIKSGNCSVHCTKYKPGKRSLCTCSYENTRPKSMPEPNRSGSIRRSQAEQNDKFSKINSATISNRSGSIKRSEIENNDQYGIITEPVSASIKSGNMQCSVHCNKYQPGKRSLCTCSYENIRPKSVPEPNRSGSIRRSQAEHSDKFSKFNSATISNRSGSIKRSEIESKDQYGIITEPVSASIKSGNMCSVHCKKYEPGKRSLCTCSYENTRPKSMPEPLYKEPLRFPTVCTSKCSAICATEQRSIATLITCVDDCPCPGQNIIEKQDLTEPCVCLPPPRSSCCNCTSPAACICQLLCNLRERIRRQTDEQNRNLDQILEELDKQDKEIQLIRQFVEKSRRSRNKHKSCIRKSAICACYPVTVHYDFNNFPPITSDKHMREDDIDSLEEEFVEIESHETELVRLYGLKNMPENDKRISEKESWKGIWKKNSKYIFSNEFFKKKSSIARKNDLSSSSGPVEDIKLHDKKKKKETKWFSKLVSSKRDLKKTTS